MSRSGYTDDCGDGEEWRIHLYRGAVDRAIAGKRGQAFLREMATALDAMPDKQLIADALVTTEGDVCAIGAVAVARKVDVSDLDIEAPEDVAERFGIARSLAAEIVYENDECGLDKETPAQRWTRMRRWVERQLREVRS